MVYDLILLLHSWKSKRSKLCTSHQSRWKKTVLVSVLMFGTSLVLITWKQNETVLRTPPLFFSVCVTLIKCGFEKRNRKTIAAGQERVRDLFRTIPGVNNLIKIIRQKDWGRLIDWRDLQRQWNKWTGQQVGIRSTLSSRPDTSRDTCERGLEDMRAQEWR